VKRRVSQPDHDGGSFRDPAGFIFMHRGAVYRQINRSGQADYDFFIKSGLYGKLAGEGLLVAHEDIKSLNDIPSDEQRYKLIRPAPIPFISYPYEWTFSQLKDAALLTLQIQRTALSFGMILKDASAYNVQFIGRRPVFIDSLSFRIYKAGAPWDGYKQFCEHFVAPLALAVYSSPDILKTLRAYIDGMPLLAVRDLLPTRAKLHKGLLAHIYLHAASQKRYDRVEPGAAAKQPKISRLALEGLISSLTKTVNRLDLPKQKTEWGDYYNDTNYSQSALTAKKKIVKKYLEKISPKPKIVWDLGANDGTFSEIAAGLGSYVVASDVDSLAVELNYTKNRSLVLRDMILPIIQDLANPSPALGWAHAERRSFEQRGPADAVMALALIHHLAISNTLPFNKIAEYFAQLGKYLIIEFIPKSDSKIQILLHRRVNMFEDYTQENFEAAFGIYFTTVAREPVRGSKRVIYLFKVKPTKIAHDK